MPARFSAPAIFDFQYGNCFFFNQVLRTAGPPQTVQSCHVLSGSIPSCRIEDKISIKKKMIDNGKILTKLST